MKQHNITIGHTSGKQQLQEMLLAKEYARKWEEKTCYVN